MGACLENAAGPTDEVGDGGYIGCHAWSVPRQCGDERAGDGWMTAFATPVQSRETSGWDDRPVLATIATAVFVWALLITTFDTFGFASTYVSRTRELMTFYVVMAVVVSALPWRRWTITTKWLIGAFLVQVVVGFAFWSAQDGSRIAINYWSQWLLALAFLLLGLTFYRACWWLWGPIIIGYALVIAGVCLAGLLFWHSPPAQLNGPAEFYGDRPVGAPAALMMVLGLVLAAGEGRLSSRVRTAVVVVLGATVVLAQHRSVWIALLVALVLLMWDGKRRGVSFRQMAGFLAVAAFFVLSAVMPVLTPWSILPSGPSAQAGPSLPDSFESVGTFSWRLDMWESRLTQSRSLMEWLTGGMWGPTPVWGPGSSVMNPTISSHSMLVDLLSMLGLLGLVVFVVLFLRATAYRWLVPPVLPICLIATAAFGFFYAWPSWAWVFLGAGLSARGNADVP